MENSEIKAITYQASMRLSIKLQKLDLVKLKLSEYNTAYLNKYLTDLDFYSNLYGQLLHKAIIKLKKPIKESTFIDYGGGSGFLSLFAKELGFKTFSPFIDESYDEEESSFKRMQKITSEVKRICSMSQDEMHEWYYEMQDIFIHNRELIKKYGERYHESQREVIDNAYEELMK